MKGSALLCEDFSTSVTTSTILNLLDKRNFSQKLWAPITEKDINNFIRNEVGRRYKLKSVEMTRSIYIKNI